MAREAKPEHALARTKKVSGVRAHARIESKVSKAKRQARELVKNAELQAIEEEIQNKGKRKGQSKRLVAPGSSSMTEKKWFRFLELTGNGLKRADILKTLRLTKQTFDVYMITSVAASKQLRAADAIWIRKSWALDEIEEVLSLVALGNTLKASCTTLGFDQARIQSFYALASKDARIKDMYDTARELQAEAWLDDIVDISDNRGDDTFVDQKGVRKTDHGVIQRDRLRVDTRRWGMGALNRSRFGEHKHVDHTGEVHVNHAIQLSHARKRLEKSKRPVTIEQKTQEVAQ